MDSRDPGARSFLPGGRRGAALLAAVLLGMTVGPAASHAATSAWVRVKNWPKSMNVRVLNWPATQNVEVRSSVPLDHPARTPMHISGLVTVAAGAYIAESAVFYTVPNGKWLTVTGISAAGGGSSLLNKLEVVGSNKSVVVIPFALQQDNAAYFLSGTVSGERCYEPGTTLTTYAARNTNPPSPWGINVYLDGYLTDKP